MNKTKVLAYVGGAVVVCVAVFYARRILGSSPAVAPVNAKGITATGTAGQAQAGATVTTPVQPTKVAYVAKNALQLLAEAGGKVVQRVASLSFPPRVDRMQPWGNAATAAGAAKSPPNTLYAQSAYSKIK